MVETAPGAGHPDTLVTRDNRLLGAKGRRLIRTVLLAGCPIPVMRIALGRDFL